MEDKSIAYDDIRTIQDLIRWIGRTPPAEYGHRIENLIDKVTVALKKIKALEQQKQRETVSTDSK
jgi:hypothetical protein